MLGLCVPMRAAFAIAVSVLSACATPSREQSLTAQTSRSESLCWWREAGWGDGVVLARGTAKPLGRVRSLEGQQVMATVTLRRAGQLALLQGRWSGPGLVLEGDVDVGTEPVIASWEPRRVGTNGLLLQGARVRVLDAAVGSVLAVPGNDSLRAFQSNEPLGIDLRCEDLSLRSVQGTPSEQVRAAGFADETPVQLARGAVALSPTVDAAVSGTIDGAHARLAFELERSGNLVRIAVPTADNVVWVGWADAAQVSAGEVPASQPRPVVEPTQEARRACREELPLAAAVSNALQRVGTLPASAEFIVVDDGDSTSEWMTVRLPLEWFEPEAKLYLPRKASRCAASNRL